MDFIQLQLDMERMFNNNQLLPRLKREFSEDGWDLKLMEQGIPVDFGLTVMAQMVLHKRADVPTMVGITRRFFKDELHVSASQQAADMLLKMAEHDFIDWSPSADKFILRVDVSADVYEDLERYQFPMPMVVPPKEVKTNSDTGYYTVRNKLLLGDADHDDDVCLDHINRVNSIEFALDSEVIRMVRLKWKNLDRPKENETLEEYQARVKAFAKYERTAYEVMEHLQLTGRPFHLTHGYDYRGRTYARGYHVNYQGSEYNKAVVCFAEQEVPT